jgi:tRNA(Ile)-lysidine synthetase-like protein
VVIQNNQIDYEAPHLDAVVFEPCVLKIGEILELSNGGVLELVHDEVSAIHLNSLQTCIYIPQDLATPYLTIRSWRPGDRYQPFGCLGTKKIKDQWIDYKIPKALRRTLPIICDASGVILWSPGLLPNEKIRLKNGQKCALRLTYQLKM